MVTFLDHQFYPAITDATNKGHFTLNYHILYISYIIHLTMYSYLYRVRGPFGRFSGFSGILLTNSVAIQYSFLDSMLYFESKYFSRLFTKDVLNVTIPARSTAFILWWSFLTVHDRCFKRYDSCSVNSIYLVVELLD